jgi:hypothetical protein
MVVKGISGVEAVFSTPLIIMVGMGGLGRVRDDELDQRGRRVLWRWRGCEVIVIFWRAYQWSPGVFTQSD